jgi:PKHD-type hydroxylase
MIEEKLIYGIKPDQTSNVIIQYTQYSGNNRVLSPPECEAIIRYGRENNLVDGAIGGGSSQHVDKDYRQAKQGTIPVDGFEWLYDRLAQRVKWTNDQLYNFHISGMNEAIQFLEYRMGEDEDEPSGHYKWHTDTGPNYTSMRKLSCVIQLTDPAEYEGCRLKLFDCQTPEYEVPEIGQGDMLIFPSFMPHMVTPLESGTRNALALWITGTPFK